MRVAKRYLISGRVQGVGFRYFTYRIAQKHNICGYVRNLPDARVEVFAEAEEADMNKFVFELQIGPPLSKIRDIKVEEAAAAGRYKSFSIE